MSDTTTPATPAQEPTAAATTPEATTPKSTATAKPEPAVKKTTSRKPAAKKSTAAKKPAAKKAASAKKPAAAAPAAAPADKNLLAGLREFKLPVLGTVELPSVDEVREDVVEFLDEVQAAVAKAPTMISDFVIDLRDHLTARTEQLSARAEDVREQVQTASHDVREQVQTASHDVREQVEAGATDVRKRATETVGFVRELVNR